MARNWRVILHPLALMNFDVAVDSYFSPRCIFAYDQMDSVERSREKEADGGMEGTEMRNANTNMHA